jgi:hypothetical protein
MQSKIKVAGLLTLLAIGAVWVPAGAHAQVDFAAVRRYATGGSPQPSAIFTVSLIRVRVVT